MEFQGKHVKNKRGCQVLYPTDESRAHNVKKVMSFFIQQIHVNRKTSAYTNDRAQTAVVLYQTCT